MGELAPVQAGDVRFENLRRVEVRATAREGRRSWRRRAPADHRAVECDRRDGARVRSNVLLDFLAVGELDGRRGDDVSAGQGLLFILLVAHEDCSGAAGEVDVFVEGGGVRRHAGDGGGGVRGQMFT